MVKDGSRRGGRRQECGVQDEAVRLVADVFAGDVVEPGGRSDSHRTVRTKPELGVPPVPPDRLGGGEEHVAVRVRHDRCGAVPSDGDQPRMVGHDHPMVLGDGAAPSRIGGDEPQSLFHFR